MMQALRFWLVQARMALLRSHSEMHPARASIHAQRSVGEWATDAIAAFAGAWLFVGLHAVWWALWWLLHLDLNLLTMILSLEAILLSTFVLMNQNRQAARDRNRDDVEAAEVGELGDINRRQLTILEQQNVILDVLLRGVPGQSASQAVDSAQPSPQAGQAPLNAFIGATAPPKAKKGAVAPLVRRRLPERQS